MTSTSIYTTIDPTYLYIKQHSITGLKYFGKTTGDPYTYNGSGKRWKSHIKKHGKEHIKTIWVSELYSDTSITEFALKFSTDNDIVKSKEWANLIMENGLDGSPLGMTHTNETKAKISIAKNGKQGKPHTDETKAKMSAAATGRIHTDETKAKLSSIKLGTTHTPETKAKMSIDRKGSVPPNKGKPTSEETKAKQSAATKGIPKPQKQVTCPHCDKVGGESNMKRWHFDKCKKNI